MRVVVHNYTTDSFAPVQLRRRVKPLVVKPRRIKTKDCGGDCGCDACKTDRDRMPLLFKDIARASTR